MRSLSESIYSSSKSTGKDKRGTVDSVLGGRGGNPVFLIKAQKLGVNKSLSKSKALFCFALHSLTFLTLGVSEITSHYDIALVCDN